MRNAAVWWGSMAARSRSRRRRFLSPVIGSTSASSVADPWVSAAAKAEPTSGANISSALTSAGSNGREEMRSTMTDPMIDPSLTMGTAAMDIGTLTRTGSSVTIMAFAWPVSTTRRRLLRSMLSRSNKLGGS